MIVNTHLLTSLCCAYSRSRVRLFGALWTSPPGSFVRGILQARILEWLAIPISLSRKSS